MKGSMISEKVGSPTGSAVRIIMLTAAVLVALSGCTAGTALYVSPDGDDTNSGSLDEPLATLEAARDAIRRMKSAGLLPADGVTVYLRGGVHRLRRMFDLAAQDSGSPGAEIVYRAFEDEQPIVSGGIQMI